MPIYYINSRDLTFPHPFLADKSGILAIGGDLSVNRLILAYRFGIFPWYNEGEPIVWWSPNPRFVLFPAKLKIAKSMRTYFNNEKYQVTYDQEFHQVIRNCAFLPRNGQAGTWITKAIINSYIQLHELGIAHSVEVWQSNKLVGGLYGIAIGKIFYGESMFSKSSNASKFGFISLVKKLEERGFTIIDCQQETNFLGSLGAELIARQTFHEYLTKNFTEASLNGNWQKIL